MSLESLQTHPKLKNMGQRVPPTSYTHECQRWSHSLYSFTARRAPEKEPTIDQELSCTVGSPSQLSDTHRDYLTDRLNTLEFGFVALPIRADCATLDCYMQDTSRSQSIIDEIE